MEKYLDAYIARMRPHYPGFPPATAHGIASAFLAFRFALWEKAESECATAIALIPDNGPNAALRKALAILQARADDRNNSRVTTELTVAFTDAERAFVAIAVSSGANEDPVSLELDNALILVYVVALITSEDDEEMLEEHRRIIIRMLTDYKKAMGME